MYQAAYSRQFQKDIDLARKRGKSLVKIRKIIELIIEGVQLHAKYRDHKLTGHYQGRRECHIESDLLLIYKLTAAEVIFERIGTHSDLFK